MAKTEFKLEKREDSNGIMVDTLIKVVDGEEEPWGNVQEFDSLFNTCARRWGNNWDLEKLKTAVTECAFD